jgi:urocanate hydratase
MRSRSLTGSFNTVSHITMRLLVPATLVLTLVLAAGCSLFHHKKPVTPEMPPAAGIQVEFRDRWVDRRAHELMAANASMAQAEANRMAEAEFAKQYPYVSAPEPQAGH